MVDLSLDDAGLNSSIADIQRAIVLFAAADRVGDDLADMTGHAGLAGKVRDFSGNWDRRRGQLQTGLQGILDALCAISETFEDLDRCMAESLEREMGDAVGRSTGGHSQGDSISTKPWAPIGGTSGGPETLTPVPPVVGVPPTTGGADIPVGPDGTAAPDGTSVPPTVGGPVPWNPPSVIPDEPEVCPPNRGVDETDPGTGGQDDPTDGEKPVPENISTLPEIIPDPDDPEVCPPRPDDSTDTGTGGQDTPTVDGKPIPEDLHTLPEKWPVPEDIGTEPFFPEPIFPEPISPDSPFSWPGGDAPSFELPLMHVDPGTVSPDVSTSATPGAQLDSESIPVRLATLERELGTYFTCKTKDS